MPVMYPCDVFIDHERQHIPLWTASLTDALRDLQATYPGRSIFVQWT